jgi:hypothetical protein
MNRNRSPSVRRSLFLKRICLAAILSVASSAALASAADPAREATESAIEPAAATALAATAAATPPATPKTVLADNSVHFGTWPVRMLRTGGPGLRPWVPIDARIITITYINRSRNPPDTYAATTREAIDAWTNTVFYGAASGLGTPVDQWVAMVYWLDR